MLFSVGRLADVVVISHTPDTALASMHPSVEKKLYIGNMKSIIASSAAVSKASYTAFRNQGLEAVTKDSPGISVSF